MLDKTMEIRKKYMELKWMRFFDLLGIEYQYRPKSFNVSVENVDIDGMGLQGLYDLDPLTVRYIPPVPDDFDQRDYGLDPDDGYLDPTDVWNPEPEDRYNIDTSYTPSFYLPEICEPYEILEDGVRKAMEDYRENNNIDNEYLDVYLDENDSIIVEPIQEKKGIYIDINPYLGCDINTELMPKWVTDTVNFLAQHASTEGKKILIAAHLPIFNQMQKEYYSPEFTISNFHLAKAGNLVYLDLQDQIHQLFSNFCYDEEYTDDGQVRLTSTPFGMEEAKMVERFFEKGCHPDGGVEPEEIIVTVDDIETDDGVEPQTFYI